eukprot:g7675.t1
MFPGQNRRVNDFPARDKVDASQRRHWTPPELPISSSILSLYSTQNESFANTSHLPENVRGSLEPWYLQRPALQQTPLGAPRDQMAHFRMPLTARPRFHPPPPSPCELRGDPYNNRSMPCRPLSYSGLESIHLTNTVPPFRTVPTSITITPSKQQQQQLRNPSSVSSTTESLLMIPTPTPTQTNPMVSPEVPVVARDHSLVTQPSPVQRYAAVYFAHCYKCKNLNCHLGGLCQHVKSIISHISHCNSTNPCRLESCYLMKRALFHYRNCQNFQCLICAQIRKVMKEVQQSEVRHDSAAAAAAAVHGLPMQIKSTPDQHLSPLENSIFSPPPPPPTPSQHDHQSKIMLDPSEALDSSSMTPIGLPGQTFNGPIFEKGLAEGDLESSTNPNPNLDRGSTGSVTSSGGFQLGTSLFETFSPDAIGEYLMAIRGGGGSGLHFLNKPEPFLKDKLCAVCLKGEQTLQPIQLYCDSCFSRIKRSGMYWKPKPETKIQICVCHKCFTMQKSDSSFHIGNFTLSKGAFRSCKNDECVTETWVACDKCGYWVHSSCGLFNRGENNEIAKYMCPFCLKEEMEIGVRKSPKERPISMRDASQLPETPVSSFIQSRLESVIKSEIGEEIGLVVRVLVSMRKSTQVQPMMLKAFPESPNEYPYRQRVIGVFQKIHGCDVLLFCMCVQEYDKNCPKPNKQWVNLEYIDSVKHFTPDLKTRSGHSMRTLVYQEVLLAYIEFVKLRGFEVFYIWACPPSKEGDDYILHCKPPSQRIPTTERLRSWYKCLLKIAKERGIVKQDSNLMDSFFTHGMDRFGASSFTPTSLPYFEGDYWPTEAEKLLKSFESTKGMDSKKKSLGKRKTRGEASLNEFLENGLMSNLKFPRWSDFMVWHLQEPCSLCHKYINNGFKFAFNSESGKPSGLLGGGVGGGGGGNLHEPVRKKAHFEGIKLGREGPMNPSRFFQLCESCFQVCHDLGDGADSIPEFVSLEDLTKEEITPCPPPPPPPPLHEDEKFEDEIFNEIFESRQSFLAFCKANHYQFDTLQHAKHTTMMLLYHLHNSEAPVFPTICNSCGIELPKSEAKSVTSSEVAICGQCRTNGKQSRSTLIQQDPNRTLQGKQGSISDRQRYFEAFQHGARCTLPYCPDPYCAKIKELFRHVCNCKIGRAGCNACRFFAMCLKQHCHSCQGNCTVPECDRIRALMKQQMRFDQVQRRRGYSPIDYSRSSSSS